MPGHQSTYNPGATLFVFDAATAAHRRGRTSKLLAAVAANELQKDVNFVLRLSNEATGKPTVGIGALP